MAGVQNSLTSLTHPALQALLAEYGQPAFRAKQLFAWLHHHHATEFSQMSNLPKSLQATLAEHWRIDAPQLRQKQLSGDDGTAKLLLGLEDGHCVETVLMHYHYGASVCISSQVGCRMGCAFCASASGGLVRNLSAGEMAAQVYAAAQHSEERINHVVLMGIGEPMDNLDNVLDFISIITDGDGHGLSGRNISLSTSGVVPGIRRLAQQKLPLTLSVSLHAANDTLRSRLMPVNRAWPLQELLSACREYAEVTRRRISFEYALMRGVNDSDADADALARCLSGIHAHVNLIRANEIEGAPFAPSGQKRTEAFAKQLEQAHIPVTLRRRLGADIDAACGQLRIRAAGLSG